MRDCQTDSGDALEKVQVYRIAMELMREAGQDAGWMVKQPQMREVAGQLLRAVGSIPANIAEGYSRGTTADRRKFYEYALGSARECIVWYQASQLPEVPQRLERLTSIRRLLLTMIRNARTDTARVRQL